MLVSSVKYVLCFWIIGIYYVCGCKHNPYFKDAGPLVKTNQGSLIGKYVKVFDSEVAAFLSIPYANPPTGEKRFQKPEPKDAWDGILLANEKPPPCMQYLDRSAPFYSNAQPSEDCLYMNVWTPSQRCCGDSRKLPVLVWVHGGAFSFGSTDLGVYDGRILASYGDVVVVTMNYRVGSFGFLNLGTTDAPGNAGLYDQSLAMRWVKENIHNFGGDPQSITLFGESAGAISANLHMISPCSRGLFHRAILQSGSAYNPQLIDRPEVARYKAAMFAKALGCAKEDGDAATQPDAVLSCLRSIDAFTLAVAESKTTSQSLILFSPSYYTEFLPKPPMEAIDSGEVAPVDILMGGMKDEGTLFMNFVDPVHFSYDDTPQISSASVKPAMSALFRTLPEPILQSLYNVYFNDVAADDNRTIIEELSNSLGDFVFNCPMLFLAERVPSAYMYWFTHRSLRKPEADWTGVQHFDDVAYVFGLPVEDTKNYTPEDRKFSGELMEMWVNFARCGHPLKEDSKQVWEKFNASNPAAFELNLRNSDNIPFPRREACEFWRSIFASS